MSHQELHLTLARAEAGMTLARTLLDTQGQVLMVQGSKLSDATISTLRRRQVTELWVLDPQSPTVDLQAQKTALRQYHQERLARLFRHIGNSADDRYLLDIMSRYRGSEPS
ncbi:hypothetical protein [Rhodoferax sp. UBA5149]|uniref:hypothetical protein n=1 Tax=Rhodoferax sp. UBA5149 TaxID=1947379 RepID=UPI0025E0CCB1|nr:hypothetical protein [Rhodoferax sp. UBA5149]